MGGENHPGLIFKENSSVFINFVGAIFMARITVEDCLGKIPQSIRARYPRFEKSETTLQGGKAAYRN